MEEDHGRTIDSLWSSLVVEVSIQMHLQDFTVFQVRFWSVFHRKPWFHFFSQFRFLHELWVKQTINCKRNIVVREPHQLTTIYLIIRLLFWDVCYRAGPFLKFEKNRHMAARKPRFGCGFTLKLRFLVSVIKP